MPSDRDFIEATRLAAELQAADADNPFVRYLAARGAGLKTDALRSLDDFTSAAGAWPDARRRAFIGWLAEARDRFDDSGLVTPHPLIVRFVLPALADWAAAEPDSPEPHLLRGLFHDYRTGEAEPEVHFRRALEREPDHPRARLELARALMERAARCGVCDPQEPELAEAQRGWLDEAAALARGLSEEPELLARIAALRDGEDSGRRYFFPA